MSEIHRMQVNVSEDFKAPAVVTFGYQEQRKSFSVWYSAVDPKVATYRIVATGSSIPSNAMLKASCVIPDGFHVFHLIELL